MKKILLFLPLLILIFAFPAYAADYTYGYYGTTTDTSSNPLYANSTDAMSAQWIDISVSGSGHGYVVWGKDDGTGHLIEDCRVAVPASGVTPSCSTGQPIAFWLVSSDGGEIHATIGHTNNPNSQTVYFSDPSGGSTSSGSTTTTSDDPDYTDVLNNIMSAVVSNGNDLQSVLSATNANGDTLKSILSQISGDVTINQGVIPNEPSISADGRLEKYQPTEKPVYQDNTTHFSDQGDTTDQANPLPAVPDVAKCWGDTCQGSVGTADPVSNQDPEKSSDPVQNQDPEKSSDPVQNQDPEKSSDPVQNQDPEKAPDPVQNQDPEQNSDPVLPPDQQMQPDQQLQPDQFNQDPVLGQDPTNQDPVPNQDQQLNQDPENTQNNFYTVTN